MTYEEFLPSLCLRPFVHRLWILEGEQAAGLAEPVLPDGHTEIIVHAGDPFVEMRGASTIRQSAVLLAGQMTRAVTLAPAGTACVVGARLCAYGAFAFFGLPQRLIADRIVPLADVDPRLAGRLDDDVASRTDRAGRVAALDRALAARVPSLDGHAPEIAAVGLAMERRGLVRVGDLARAADVGPRQLERVFHERVGIAPKQLLRILRFQEVLGALRAGSPMPDWSQVALGHGFYDQAHFVRDFKQFTGTTPAAWHVREESLTAVFSALRRREVIFVNG